MDLPQKKRKEWQTSAGPSELHRTVEFLAGRLTKTPKVVSMDQFVSNRVIEASFLRANG